MSTRCRLLLRWLLMEEGSTRAVALLRIGLALQVWSRWAGDFLLFQADSPERWVLDVSFYTASTLMLLGLWSRLTTAWTGATLLYIVYELGVHRGVQAYAHHHTYALAVATCLLALAPCGGSFSIDRALAVRRARATGRPIPAERGDLWATRLLGAHVSAIYFWSAVSKLTAGYLGGQRLQQIYVQYYTASDYPAAACFAQVCAVLAVASVALEFALALGLWLPGPRRWLIPLGIAFHAVLYVTLPVLTFSATMWLLYLAFVPPQTVHDAIEALVGRPLDPATG